MINAAKTSQMAKRRIPGNIPTIVAVGSSLAALPAAALELGELTVHSRLGQPLRASIAFALAPNEQISNYCVSLRPGASVSGLPGFGPATISISNGVILVAGQAPVREPMVSAHLIVNCPYSANLSREYMLLVDPMIDAYEQPLVTQQVAADSQPVEVVAASVARPQTAVRAAPVVKDLGTATRYQVRSGDTLSTIAQRIENRPIGLWPAVNAIFEANPDAFRDNDPNKLKAGSWLSIPSFDGNTVEIAAAQAVVETPVVDSTPYEAAFEPTAADASASVAAPVEAAADAVTETPGEVILDDLATSETTTDLQPGDITLSTELQPAETASSSPNVPTAIVRTPETATGTASSSRMYWFAGGGLALLFGLLMFGRRLRGSTDTAPTDFAAEQPNRRRFSDMDTTDTENIEAVGVDFDLSDDSPTQENLALDADLVMGTGLDHNADSDIAEDFGFGATTELDVELPFEPVESISDDTDMLQSLNTDEVSILDSEVLPGGDNDYDMSVIVDATKMPQPEDATERDLKAVEVSPEDETLIAQNYTISKEVDYQVLEQDYEDEMSATQALNEEIARAALEIAEEMEGADDDATAALPLASVTELDVTAQMPAQNDEISDLDDTGINEVVTVNTATDEETVEMPAKNGKAS